MTPKEKAKELVEKLLWLSSWGIEDTEHFGRENAKKIAKIAVDEILATDPTSFRKYQFKEDCVEVKFEWTHDYWHQVKEEIDKL